MSRADLELKELQAFSPEIQPAGGLVQAADGYFYGLTQNGGVAGTGMIYRLSPDSPLEQVYSFAALIPWPPDLNLQGAELNVGGAYPKGTLIYSPEGCLYGFTVYGGAFGRGVVFRYDLGGAFSVLYDLDPIKGSMPEHLLLTRNGDLYLTCESGGGAGKASGGGGTIIRISRNEVELVHQFNSWVFDLLAPCAPIFLAENSEGRIYGITSGGGIPLPHPDGGHSRPGTVFRLEEHGITEFPYSTMGSRPSFLFAAKDGGFYGTNLFSVIRLSEQVETSEIWRAGDVDNWWTIRFYSRTNALILGSDGSLYGESQSGGTYGGGFLYRVAPDGTVTILHNYPFEYGFNSRTGLTESKDGCLYFVTKASEVPAPAAREVARSLRTTTAARSNSGKAFRVRVSDPLNGDELPIARPDRVLLKKVKGLVSEARVNVLANDSDPDGDTLTVTSVTKPKYGTVEIDNGQIVYRPDDPKKLRSDRCFYEISDGRGGLATGVVAFRVAGKGRYSGRLRSRSLAAPVGTYALNVSTEGTVTGKIVVGKNSYRVDGWLDENDRFQGKFSTRKESTIEINAALHFAPKAKLRGEVKPVRKAGRFVYQFK
ncbi:MAG: hypothetical protein EOP84_06605 [Verrucomicrobiaceae bacterium]|nr:MAG: hypothetical protein EOP84_06605 [Verrucomicrobiaceae bacterium]